MYFDIKKSTTTGEYWFVGKSGNHGTIVTSELYEGKQSAKKAIKIVKDEARAATVYDETGEVGGGVDDKKVSV